MDGRPRESEKTLSKYLVTVVEKFWDNWATDEASGTCYEDTHCLCLVSQVVRYERMMLVTGWNSYGRADVGVYMLVTQ